MKYVKISPIKPSKHRVWIIKKLCSNFAWNNFDLRPPHGDDRAESVPSKIIVTMKMDSVPSMTTAATGTGLARRARACLGVGRPRHLQQVLMLKITSSKTIDDVFIDCKSYLVSKAVITTSLVAMHAGCNAMS